MRSRVQILTAALILAATFGTGVSKLDAAQPDSTEVEYQVKAGFVYNFIKFVSWPEDETQTSEVWRIGVLGDDSVVATMTEALAGKNIGGQSVIVSAIHNDEDLAECHVVFIAGKYTDSSADQIASIRRSAILVVGETPDFARKYGIIGFVKRRDNLRLEINPGRAQEAGLIISGKLASLADLVEDKL